MLVLSVLLLLAGHGACFEPIEDYAPESPADHITHNEHRLRHFGRGRYFDSRPLLTWDELQVNRHLGASCDPAYEATPQCGRGLVCRQGLCRQCSHDKECPSLHHCVKHHMGRQRACVPDERKAWDTAMSNPWEGICTLIIFCCAIIAAFAGTGGGGMYVAVLVSLSTLKAELAVPLSQCMIFFSSVANLAAVLARRHPDFHHLPVIDYDCIMLFEPLLCLGVTMGVLINLMAPLWLLLIILCITLGTALWRTMFKGIKQLKDEQKAEPAVAHREMPAMLYSETFIELTNIKAWQVVGIVVVWLVILLSSFHGLPVCTGSFAVFLVVLTVLLAASSVAAARFIASKEERGPMNWVFGGSLAVSLRIPAVAFGTGLLAGFLGLGGGIILGPLLLELGMHSEAVQATTVTFVFLSSSIATIQFALLSQLVWHYALWYSAVSVAATILGQVLCEVYVRKRRNYSFVTLSIALVLLASLVLLAVIGTVQFVEELRTGGRMWFSMGRLCESGFGIVAVDVLPAQPWPSDLLHLGGY